MAHSGVIDFSNFGSLKSTETPEPLAPRAPNRHFSNFGSLKSTETIRSIRQNTRFVKISAISAR